VCTLSLLTQCGKAERPVEAGAGSLPPAASDTTAPLDTMPVTAALPESFPADFPFPSDASALGARTRVEAGGSLSEISLVKRAPPDSLLAWYGDALREAGWDVSLGPDLHATQGESYIDMTVRPWRQGWARIDATIWKMAP